MLEDKSYKEKLSHLRELTGLKERTIKRYIAISKLSPTVKEVAQGSAPGALDSHTLEAMATKLKDAPIEAHLRALDVVSEMDREEAGKYIDEVRDSSPPLREALLCGHITTEQANELNHIHNEDLQRQALRELSTFNKPIVEPKKIIEDAQREDKGLEPLYYKPKKEESWTSFGRDYFKAGRKYRERIDYTLEVVKYIPPTIRREIEKNNLMLSRHMEKLEAAFEKNPYTLTLKVGQITPEPPLKTGEKKE